MNQWQIHSRYSYSGHILGRVVDPWQMLGKCSAEFGDVKAPGVQYCAVPRNVMAEDLASKRHSETDAASGFGDLHTLRDDTTIL